MDPIQILKIKCVYFIIIFIVASGCGETKIYTHTPEKGITFTIELKEFEFQDSHGATFLYYDLVINNNSDARIYFSPGKLQAASGDNLSEASYYDSLASAMPEEKELARGESVYHLYFMFPGVIDKAKEVVIRNFGLRKK